MANRKGFDVPGRRCAVFVLFVLAKSIFVIQILCSQPMRCNCERRARAEIPQNSTPHRIPRGHNAMCVSTTSNDTRSSGVLYVMYVADGPTARLKVSRKRPGMGCSAAERRVERVGWHGFSGHDSVRARRGGRRSSCFPISTHPASTV